jgi:hypothetical protein
MIRVDMIFNVHGRLFLIITTLKTKVEVVYLNKFHQLDTFAVILYYFCIKFLNYESINQTK